MDFNQNKLWDEKWENNDLKFIVSNFCKRVCEKQVKPQNKKLLDLGCGQGGEALYFGKLGYDVIAVDFSKNALRKLDNEIENKNIKNVRSVLSDIKDVKFDSDLFDVVYANLSLHYFDDFTTKRIFEKVFLILKNKGEFIGRVKSVDDFLFGKGTKISDNYFLRNNKTSHFFDVESIKNLLCDFKEVKVELVEEEHQTMDGRNVVSSFIEFSALK